MRPDKAGKDNNFRGLTIFKNTMYVTKGSGGNGINTVYQVGTAGTLSNRKHCNSGGAAHHHACRAFRPLASGYRPPANQNHPFPFGIWFAECKTLYVCDEGDGAITREMGTWRTLRLATAGVQKWSLVDGTWLWITSCKTA